MVAWIVAGVSLAALVGVIAFSRRAPAPPAAAARDARDGAPATGGPPDLSQMTPRDAADRLFNRVMKLQDEGKRDSVSFFAPMAMTAYEALAPLDADARFHLGAVGIATGDPTLARIARAQADTILAGRSTHLLGLVLGAQAAALLGDTKAARDFTARLLAAEARELAAPLDEYLQHRSVIDNALRMARTSK